MNDLVRNFITIASLYGAERSWVALERMVVDEWIDDYSHHFDWAGGRDACLELFAHVHAVALNPEANLEAVAEAWVTMCRDHPPLAASWPFSDYSGLTLWRD